MPDGRCLLFAIFLELPLTPLRLLRDTDAIGYVTLFHEAADFDADAHEPPAMVDAFAPAAYQRLCFACIAAITTLIQSCCETVTRCCMPALQRFAAAARYADTTLIRLITLSPLRHATLHAMPSPLSLRHYAMPPLP